MSAETAGKAPGSSKDKPVMLNRDVKMKDLVDLAMAAEARCVVVRLSSFPFLFIFETFEHHSCILGT
jgi:hypothetical protein